MGSGILGDGIVARAHQLGLVSLADLEACWERLGTRNVSDEELVRELIHQGVLTDFHVTKLQRGDTKGYFFGRYKILYKIASGSFARVYRAIDRTTGETAAVKVLRQRWSSDPASVEAFKHEARVGLLLRHPNIVRVDEIGEADGQYYIGMEFVEGGNLRQFLRIRGRLSEEEALPLMVDMLRGLAYAFDKGVTHRDLKLTNVLIAANGVAKLVDFGLATLHDSEQKAEEAHGQRTVEYARLEKMTGAPYGDPRSDIFFLGCIFYQMVTGVPPIPEKKDRASRMLRTRLDNIPPVLKTAPDVNRQIAAIIDRMMVLDPDLRYQTPHAVLEDLYAIRRISRPTDREVEEIAAREQKEKASQQGPALQERPTILWMEADPRLQEEVRERLHRLGYRVLVVADPDRAFRRFLDSDAALVICDCQTEGRTGFEKVRQMLERARLTGRRARAIVLVLPEQKQWLNELQEYAKDVKALVHPASWKQLKQVVLELLPLPGPVSEAVE